MNRYCVPLNIITNPFKEGINPFDFPKIRHSKLDYKDVFNEQIKEWFDSFNLEICLLEVFYSHPFFVGSIHRDNDQGNLPKINWVFGGKHSVMQWYKLKDGCAETRVNTAIDTVAIHYDKTFCDLVHSQNISQPSIVRVGEPHGVRNLTEDRYCISTVFRDKDTLKVPGMEDTVAMFKDYIA